jgi:glyceraldehyde-3-phosphate dehydrogenase (NADP+)
MRRLPAYRRSEILTTSAAILRQRRDEIAATLAGEAGKPLKDAAVEADRAAATFQAAADEARRLSGEVVPMDLAAHGVGRFAVMRRFPLGPIAAISPFNFPLNLSAHKIGPAIAAGNPIVLKPATKTPLSALYLAEIVTEAGLPEGAISVLPMARATGDRLVTDPRFRLLTFTGSSPVGWDMKARAGTVPTWRLPRSGSRPGASPSPGRAASPSSGCTCMNAWSTTSPRGSWPSCRGSRLAIRWIRQPTSAR